MVGKPVQPMPQAPVDLVALDGERDLLRAGIAGDDAEFCAEQIVHHRRQVARGAAGIAGAENDFVAQRVLKRLGRRVAA
jgi:hypothetical protein